MNNTIKKLFRIGTIGVSLVSLCFGLTSRLDTFYSLQPMEAHRRVCNLLLSERWNALSQHTTVTALQQLRNLTSPGESKSIRTFIEDKKPRSYVHTVFVVGVYGEHSKDVCFMYQYSRRTGWFLWHVQGGD